MNSQSSTTVLEQQQQAREYLLQGDYSQAAVLYEQVLTAEPDIKCHYWHLGLVLLLQEQVEEAQTTWLMGMLEGEPEQVELWNSELAQVLEEEARRREGLSEDSVAWAIRQQIQEICPKDINNSLHLISLAIKLDSCTEEQLSEVAQILQGESSQEVEVELLIQVSQSVLNYAALYPSALEFLEACLAYIHDEPQVVALLNILMPAAIEVGYFKRQPQIAAQFLELGLRLRENSPDFLNHLACFYQNSDQYDKGIETAKLFYSTVEELPDKIYASKTLLRGYMTAGGFWEEACSAFQQQQSMLELLLAEQPLNLSLYRVTRLLNSFFFAPYFRDQPRSNRQIQNQVAQLCQTNTELQVQALVERYRQGHKARKSLQNRKKVLKIGYLSHCLKSHSVGWLARWLFQYHDHDKFQIYAYMFTSSNSYDSLQEWYMEQVHTAYLSTDVNTLAEQIYQDEIDILIDLDSITLDGTCEVLKLKPAPIQATWLGWDASGLPTIDYFIADPFVLPEYAQEYYSEKIWRLPQTFIAVDGFEVGIPTLRRDQLNIESDAVVYLSAQKGYKRHIDTVRLQMRIIKEVPNSYFLIKGSSDTKAIEDSFTRIAEEEGVDSSRLRFLPSTPSEAIHRANLGIADVVLDTYPYNGATTTLETLWMGVPLVTRVGEQFSARNSYTMMLNAGIQEGIAWSDEEYVEWGVRLGKEAALRQQISWKLRQSRQTAPLWNGKQFTREMENAYEQMWQRYIDAS
ncbi:MAG: O-linked N-acetylglucosamine transferase, SPINDLY family protein [Kastovskya adunca ATA6-11-RM4]|jgi:predicted O-linked N-acetylglucosamine transferase (SPINDLY family)|nr:O-linked N-acetylglucosamine transferase, SPINDLY family protein [Kastovskya adunca ATA6-11-RM4]